MDFKRIFSKGDKTRPDHESTLKDTEDKDNGEEEPGAGNGLEIITEGLPKDPCRFCYKPFNTGDDAYKCTNCETYYHYPICIRNQKSCRVCGEKIIKSSKSVKLVDFRYTRCPKCKNKIKLPYGLEPKLHIKCPNCSSEGRVPNPYLKDRETKDKDQIEPTEEMSIESEPEPVEQKVAPSEGAEIIKPGSIPYRKPKLEILEESITCHVCFGVVKTGLPVVICRCGKKFHESCANRVGRCPICEAKLDDYEPVDELARSRSEKFAASEPESEVALEGDIEPVPETAPESTDDVTAGVEPEPEPETVVTSKTEPIPEYEPEIELDENVTFDNYMINDENRIIHSIVQGVAQAPGSEFKLLYLHGAKGLGKTHLLQAIGNYAQNYNSNLKVRYAPTRQFLSEFEQAVDSGKQKEFEAYFNDADIFLLDDLNEISSKKATQYMLNKIFDNFLKNNKQIVITGDRPVDAIKALTKNLTNRLKDGLNIQLTPPGPKLRKEILKKHVSSETVKLLEDLIETSATNGADDLRELKKELSKRIFSNKD